MRRRRARREGAGRTCPLVVVLALLAGVLGGCGEGDRKPKTGSNSNWLSACQSDEECGPDTVCLCGACSSPCEGDGDCASLQGGQCALPSDSALASQCAHTGGSAPGGLCFPSCTPGGCEQGQACIGGACILYPVPQVPLCDAVSVAPAESRVAEETLIELVQQARTLGETDCQQGRTPAPAPQLRARPSLSCVARVLAADFVAGVASGAEDGEGRDAGARLQLAGYSPSLWWEMVALNTPSPGEALARILSEPTYCTVLTSPEPVDLGVGYSGGVYVITLATP